MAYRDGLLDATTPFSSLWLQERGFCALGTPSLPHIFNAKSDDVERLEAFDCVVTDRLEGISRGPTHPPRFGVYMADQVTWLEPSVGSGRSVAAFDVVLVSSAQPTHSVSSPGTRHLSLFLPSSMVLHHIKGAEQLPSGSLGLDPSTLEGARSIMRALRSSMEADRFNAVGYRLISALLSLLSVVGDRETQARPPKMRRREQIAACIRKNFEDPDFNVKAIADMLGISPRYLQRISEGDLSPGEQLREHRLKTAAKQLRDRAFSDRSITEICFGCGFGSSSHFSTEFRRFFGVSPRRYRAQSGNDPN